MIVKNRKGPFISEPISGRGLFLDPRFGLRIKCAGLQLEHPIKI